MPPQQAGGIKGRPPAASEFGQRPAQIVPPAPAKPTGGFAKVLPPPTIPPSTVSPSTLADSAPLADLVCRVETGSYKDLSKGKTQGAVHFLDCGRVRVIVENLSPVPTGACKIGLVRHDVPTQGTLQTSLAKLSGPALLLQPNIPSNKTAQPTPWLATADVPPLKGMETASVWLPLPVSERTAMGAGISPCTYQVMADSHGDVTEGISSKTPGEMNNWSNGFYAKDGPYIEDFQVESNSLMPGEPLRFWARVHGSSRWAIQYEYPNSPLPTQLFDKDPLQQKPFPRLDEGTFITLPWLPWPAGGPQGPYPKMTFSLIVWNSNDTAKDSRQLPISRDDFDGEFQIVDAGCSYTQATHKIEQVWVKVKADCNKDIKIGAYGDPAAGSMYVNCTILNPVKIVDVFDADPEQYNIVSVLRCVEGKIVSQGVYCADPNAAKSGANSLLQVFVPGTPIWPWGKGPLPGKCTMNLLMFPVCSEKVEGMASGGSSAWPFQPGGFVQYHKPEIRIELVIHTAKKTVRLKKTVAVANAPNTWGVGKEKSEEIEPVDHSRFLGLGEW
jgi:hypothetical protein